MWSAPPPCSDAQGHVPWQQLPSTSSALQGSGSDPTTGRKISAPSSTPRLPSDTSVSAVPSKASQAPGMLQLLAPTRDEPLPQAGCVSPALSPLITPGGRRATATATAHRGGLWAAPAHARWLQAVGCRDASRPGIKPAEPGRAGQQSHKGNCWGGGGMWKSIHGVASASPAQLQK